MTDYILLLPPHAKNQSSDILKGGGNHVVPRRMAQEGNMVCFIVVQEWHKKLLNKANSDVKGNGYDDPLEGNLELPK